ncbi:MAG: hypothetical protein EOO44_15330 [Flavobacterium sp.]|nr:MAG: hypothetical protein EOO44_15330 [Flavobacterium sp.]
MMKKFACLILFALLLNGCDDGDITVETIDFTKIESTSCTKTNELIYKLKSQEALLLQMPVETLKNNPTDVGKPALFSINNTNFRLFYRSYDGAVSKSNICDLIPPTTPKIINEWHAISGTIEIVTTAQTTLNETTQATTISGYTHNIVITNLTYSIEGMNVTNPEIVFGDFKTTIDDDDKLNLTFIIAPALCPDKKQLHVYNQNSAMTIDNIDQTLIQNVVTPVNQPRTAVLGATNNKLLYNVYKEGVLNEDYFCKSPAPTSPALKETWTAVNGVDGVSGIIEVTTTTEGNNFVHTIRLRNTFLTKENNKFNLGTSYLLGVLKTPN